MRHKAYLRTLAAATALAVIAAACGDEPEAETASVAGTEGNGAATDTATETPTPGDQAEVVDQDDAGENDVPDEAGTVEVESMPDEGGEAATGDEVDDGNAGEEPAADGSDDEPVASVDGTWPFTELEVLDLRRDGDTVTLDFVLVTTAEVPDEIAMEVDPGEDTIDVRNVFNAPEDRPETFGDEAMEGIRDATTAALSISGASLVDRDNNNRHLVERDTTGECLCTSFSSDQLLLGLPYRHSAQFQAPPDDVTSMTVEVPNFPYIDDVPIREG